MTKYEWDQNQKTTEKMLIQAWFQVQANIKQESTSSDFELNLYAMAEYKKFGEKLREALPKLSAADYQTLTAMIETSGEVAKELEHYDRLNYQKFMQTMRYINEVRHNKMPLRVKA